MGNNVLCDNNNCINEFIYTHTIKCESCVPSQVLFLVEPIFVHYILRKIPSCNTDSSVFQLHREVIFHRKASRPWRCSFIVGGQKRRSGTKDCRTQVERYQGLPNTGGEVPRTARQVERKAHNVSWLLSAPNKSHSLTFTGYFLQTKQNAETCLGSGETKDSVSIFHVLTIDWIRNTMVRKMSNDRDK